MIMMAAKSRTYCD